MSTTMPRIRGDLQATPTEEQGIKYFDVRDPRSGVQMRMYDFEWLIAAQMDGMREFSELANWAQRELRLSPTSADLSEYAAKLQALGFFEPDGEPSSSLARPPGRQAAAPLEPRAAAVVELEAPRLAMSEPDSDLEMEIGEEPQSSSRTATLTAPISPSWALEAPPRGTDDGPSRWYDESDSSTPLSSDPLVDERTDQVELATPARRSSGIGSILGVIGVMVLAAGVVAYVKFLGPSTAAKVTVQLAEPPHEVVRFYEGSAPIKKSESQELSFGEDGKVSDIVAQGTEVKAGAPLATLEPFAKVEKDLSDVKDRAAYYERLLQAARAKNAEEEIKRAEAKVAEKQKLVADFEARLRRLRIVASSAGSVTQVLVAIGQDAKAGRPVIKVSDPRITAEFKLPATTLPPLGAMVSLQKEGGGPLFAGRVAHRGTGTTLVEVLDERMAKAGDTVRLVKAKVPNVIALPPSALVKRDGAETIFVLSSGQVHLRKVTVVDRSPGEVLVGTGVAAGDSVVTGGGETLTDGQSAASASAK